MNRKAKTEQQRTNAALLRLQNPATRAAVIAAAQQVTAIMPIRSGKRIIRGWVQAVREEVGL